MTTSTQTLTVRKRSQRRGVSMTGEEMKAEAQALRKSGATLQEIAVSLGVSREWARQLSLGVERGYREKAVDPVRHKREQQKQKLDAMLGLLQRDFSLHCRRLRQALKLTQSNFGLELGLGNAAGVIVSRWESSKHKPQKRILLKFMELQNKFDSQERKQA